MNHKTITLDSAVILNNLSRSLVTLTNIPDPNFILKLIVCDSPHSDPEDFIDAINMYYSLNQLNALTTDECDLIMDQVNEISVHLNRLLMRVGMFDERIKIVDAMVTDTVLNITVMEVS